MFFGDIFIGTLFPQILTYELNKEIVENSEFIIGNNIKTLTLKKIRAD